MQFAVRHEVIPGPGVKGCVVLANWVTVAKCVRTGRIWGKGGVPRWEFFAFSF